MPKLLHTGPVSLALFLLFTSGRSNLQESVAGAHEPANSKAIDAVFDGMLIDDQNRLRIFYILKNAADAQYRIAKQSEVDVMLVLRRGAKTSLVPSGQRIKIDCPILILAHAQRIITITDVSRTYDFKQRLPLHATPEQQREYEKNLAAFLRIQWPELQGFVIFDKNKRYRIELPEPW